MTPWSKEGSTDVGLMRFALWAGVAGAALGCGGTATGPGAAGGPSGTVVVTNVTTGEDEDQGDYTVEVGPVTRVMAKNAVATFNGVPVGNAPVEYKALAINCELFNPPGAVTVVEGETSQVTFRVACVPPNGTLRVNNQTTGPILFLQLRDCGTTEYGPDILPPDPVNGVIQRNDTRSFQLHWGCYDVRASYLATPTGGALISQESFAVEVAFQRFSNLTFFP